MIDEQGACTRAIDASDDEEQKRAHTHVSAFVPNEDDDNEDDNDNDKLAHKCSSAMICVSSLKTMLTLGRGGGRLRNQAPPLIFALTR